jgi:hypothetical protein
MHENDQLLSGRKALYQFGNFTPVARGAVGKAFTQFFQLLTCKDLSYWNGLRSQHKRAYQHFPVRLVQSNSIINNTMLNGILGLEGVTHSATDLELFNSELNKQKQIFPEAEIIIHNDSGALYRSKAKRRYIHFPTLYVWNSTEKEYRPHQPIATVNYQIEAEHYTIDVHRLVDSPNRPRRWSNPH